jgi:hypothetical protein
MNWTVDATAEAEEELADIWLQASDRSAVTQAQAAIEQRLETDHLVQKSHSPKASGD